MVMAIARLQRPCSPNGGTLSTPVIRLVPRRIGASIPLAIEAGPPIALWPEIYGVSRQFN